LRIFIAVEIPDEIKDGIEKEIKRLKRLGGNIKWVKRNAIHITLKFLGEVDKEKIEWIEKAMEKTVEGFQSFGISIERCGTFPPHSFRPRVLWVGTKDEKPLVPLQERLETELAKLGFKKETRAFSPHVTIGRVRGNSAIRKVIGEIRAIERKEFGKMVADRITLFSSTPTPEGPIYKGLHEARLE